LFGGENFVGIMDGMELLRKWVGRNFAIRGDSGLLSLAGVSVADLLGMELDEADWWDAGEFSRWDDPCRILRSEWCELNDV
jgi:hypothetical protein